MPPTFTGQLNKVIPLRNLSAALSACIYQCLCDSDNFVVQMSDAVSIGMEGFARFVSNPYSWGVAFRRQNLTSEGDPLAERSNILIYNIYILMSDAVSIGMEGFARSVCNPYSAGIAFRHQNLTSKVDASAERSISCRPIT